jgi:hypothetical protein
MFRMNGYVQDERYIAIEHMDVRRDRVSFAQRLATCMGAKAAQYLASGHAVKHPCALILDFLSRKVLKQGTVHPRLNGNAYSNGFR